MLYIGKRLSILAALSCGGSAVLGDVIQAKCVDRVVLAFIDNITHFLVAFFTWMSIAAFKSPLKSVYLNEIFLCGLIGSAIDIDHFVSAQSWHLSDATALARRPFFHCTTLILAITVIFLILSRLLSLPMLWDGAWIFLAAGLSHHIRDAARRGFWIWPFGSTPPVPYTLYIILLVIFPLCLPHLQSMFSIPETNSTDLYQIV